MKSKKNKKIRIIDIDKVLKIFKEAQLNQAKVDGENIALTQPPKDVSYLRNLPSFTRLFTNYNSKSAEIAVIYRKDIEQNFTEHEQAIADFNSNETSEAKAELEDLEKEEQKSIEDALVSHNEIIEDKRETLLVLKGTIKNLKATLRTLKRHNLWPSYIIAGVLIVIIISGEIFFTRDSLEFAGYSRDYARIIGTALATVTFMLSIALSFVLRTSWSKIIKTFASLTIFGIVSSMYYTLGSIRVTMMSAESESDGLFGLTGLHFMVFSMAFFIAMFAVKFFIFPAPEKVKQNNDFKQASKKLKEAEKREKETKAEVNGAHKSREETKKSVQKEFAPRKMEVAKRIVDNASRIKTTAIAFNEKLSTAKSFYTQINNDYLAVASSFFATINLYRNDDISLPIPELKNLDNPFEDYVPLKTFEGAKQKQPN